MQTVSSLSSVVLLKMMLTLFFKHQSTAQVEHITNNSSNIKDVAETAL
jgi:hypothetical protein